MGNDGYLIVSYDLPSSSKMYYQFKAELKRNGFEMIHESLYIKYCKNLELSELTIKKFDEFISKGPSIIFLKITSLEMDRAKSYNKNTIPINADSIITI